MLNRPLELHDRGASAILVAFSLLLLMGMAALAVDYGLGVNERRLDQNTGDVAALSGGVELIVSGDPQAMVDTIKDYVDQNLGRVVSDDDWTSCTDPGALEHPSDTIPGISNGSNCISLGPSSEGIAFARLRVRVPNQTTPTAFGRLLGVTGLVTSAIAEVELEDTVASGAFPAAVFSGAATGDGFCIRTGTSGHESCGDPSTGDFGSFQPYFYTELAPGAPHTLCTSGNQMAPLARTMADGIDHFLGISPTPTGTRRNGGNCPHFPGPLFPNRVDSGSGDPDSVTMGLITGGNYDGAYLGRLSRKTWSGFSTAQIFGHAIDNRPLWSYIDTSVLGPSSPPACHAAATGPDSHTDSSDAAAELLFTQAQQDLENCLAHPNAPESLFHEDLYESPRLTIVPRYWESAPLPSNACCYNIQAFEPVFLDGIWTPESNHWTCDQGMVRDPVEGFCKHEPGRSGTINIHAAGQRKVTSASAIVLTCELLPGLDAPAQKCQKVGTGPSAQEVFLNLFLVR